MGTLRHSSMETEVASRLVDSAPPRLLSVPTTANHKNDTDHEIPQVSLCQSLAPLP